MNPSYKLLGTYWDNLPTNDSTKQILNRRKASLGNVISFKKLLTVQSDEDFMSLISEFDSHDEIVIDVDYWTKSSNPIICTFLNKRLEQMLFHLNNFFNDVYFILQ